MNRHRVTVEVSGRMGNKNCISAPPAYALPTAK
jgi:hypothetical protein